MTFKKAGLVLVWIDRRILCLHSTARYWANLLCKHPFLTRGKKNTVFHQPQDSQDWRTWDLVTRLVYIKRERLCYSHKPVTLYIHRTDTTPVLVTSGHLIFHHKEAVQAQPKLSTPTNLYLNHTTNPDYKTAKQACCQWDAARYQDSYFETSSWLLQLCLHQPLLKLLKKKLITTWLINGLRWKAVWKCKSIHNNNY